MTGLREARADLDIATECVLALFRGQDNEEARQGASLLAAACLSLLPEKI